jgi:hypothetical protein
MSISRRQNNLFLAEDWKKIYQTFKNADFTSYDFENLRRVMIQYLRENYPEDFNDYIESSEYLALIDLIAFLGQSLAFRTDLNARENILETASRRESVLRLAELISYNSKRNLCANGLLKIDSMSTTEEIIDSSGRNLANIEVSWNDTSNNNWFDQFTKIMNSAMIDELTFGVPQTLDLINGIQTEQYRLNSRINDLPVFSFSKTVDGRSLQFEITSTIIEDGNVKEDPPKLGNNIALLYKSDSKGFSSINTGWFMHFRQGTLIQRDFVINTPTTNEIIEIDDVNINQDDVWLYSMVPNENREDELWTRVDAIVGNNVIYNSIEKTIKNVYRVKTRPQDSISLVFGDGLFANLPKGSFKCYYRTSNGLTYTVSPRDMRGIVISIPYLSKKGTTEVLRINLSLKSSVNNAVSTETNDEIKLRAPATYYTQNRMISGEDYNLAPLSISQDISKVKTINRVASGISRSFDLIDTTGKYSKINTFCTDGIIYREDISRSFNFGFNSRTDIEMTLKNRIEPLLKQSLIRDFYYEKYNKIRLTELNPVLESITSGFNQTTAFFGDSTDKLPFKVGAFSGTSLKYIQPGALVKFIAPTGFYFHKNGTLVNSPSFDTTTKKWAKVISVVGDGTASGTGILPTGLGPIVFNEIIPSGAIVQQIIPKFVTDLPDDIESIIIELIFNFRNFGLRYDLPTRTWQIIQQRNLNLTNTWNLGKTGDNSGQNLDSSWLISFINDGETYTITYRGLEYYFESVLENRFFFDGTKKIFDPKTGKVQKDLIKVLSFNTNPNESTSLGRDISFEIIGTTEEADGFASTKAVKITFSDLDDDGIVDDPETFNDIVNPILQNSNRFVFFEKYLTDGFIEDYKLFDNTDNRIIVFNLESEISNLSVYNDQQLFYFTTVDQVKVFNKQQGRLLTSTDYFVDVGRSDLKFHYIHNADSNIRIDPSASNIMDIYILTKSYDNEFRRWLKGNRDVEPLPPSTTDLKLTYDSKLNKIKSISDELIYHSVRYKILFGDKASPNFRAKFKVVKNKEQVITDNDVKTRIIRAINEFFNIENWDFGDTFYFTELATYVMNELSPFITTFLIVPENADQVYGSLQQILSLPNEVFVSGATVADIDIIDTITATKIKASGLIVTTTTADLTSTRIQSRK